MMNKKYLLLMLFVLAFCKKQEVKYQTFEVLQKDLQKNVEASGSVESENIVEVFPPVSGRLEKMFVKEGDLVKAKQRIATMSSENRSQIIDMAASKGKDEVEYWKSQMLLTPIYSPVAGKIITVKVQDAGERVSGSVAQISTGEIIRVNIDESDLPSIRLDQNVDIHFDIHAKKSLKGVLKKISQTSKLVNNVNVYQVEVALPPEDKQKKLPFEIKIGMSVTLFFSVHEKQGAKALDVAAVNGRSNRTISLLKQDGTKVKVKLGDIYGDWVEILEGLEIGEKIKIPEFKASGAKVRKSPLMLKKE
ncbi:MAG: HlyD family efflux transporter periplasmic adaptor subunit [Bdellovibrionota bacterium]